MPRSRLRFAVVGAGEPLEHDVFIAYARADERHAHALEQALQAEGLSTFVDTRSVRLGSLFGRAITRGQRQSALTAVIVTEETEASVYVEEEVARAVALSRSRGHGLVPIFVEVGPDHAPYGARAFAGVSLGEGGWAAVARRLAAARKDVHVPPAEPSPRARRWTAPLVGLVLLAVLSPLWGWLANGAREVVLGVPHALRGGYPWPELARDGLEAVASTAAFSVLGVWGSPGPERFLPAVVVVLLVAHASVLPLMRRAGAGVALGGVLAVFALAASLHLAAVNVRHVPFREASWSCDDGPTAWNDVAEGVCSWLHNGGSRNEARAEGVAGGWAWLLAGPAYVLWRLRRRDWGAWRWALGAPALLLALALVWVWPRGYAIAAWGLRSQPVRVGAACAGIGMGCRGWLVSHGASPRVLMLGKACGGPRFVSVGASCTLEPDGHEEVVLDGE